MIQIPDTYLKKKGFKKLGLDFPGFDLILLESQTSKEDSNYGFFSAMD